MPKIDICWEAGLGATAMRVAQKSRRTFRLRYDPRKTRVIIHDCLPQLLLASLSCKYFWIPSIPLVVCIRVSVQRRVAFYYSCPCVSLRQSSRTWAPSKCLALLAVFHGLVSPCIRTWRFACDDDRFPSPPAFVSATYTTLLVTTVLLYAFIFLCDCCVCGCCMTLV